MLISFIFLSNRDAYVCSLCARTWTQRFRIAAHTRTALSLSHFVWHVISTDVQMRTLRGRALLMHRVKTVTKLCNRTIFKWNSIEMNKINSTIVPSVFGWRDARNHGSTLCDKSRSFASINWTHASIAWSAERSNPFMFAHQWQVACIGRKYNFPCSIIIVRHI